jgi:multidrug efflux system outer membrane protein
LHRRPRLQAPAELPKDYGVAQSALPPAERWWTLFNDPVLDRLVDEALAANHDLKAAAARVEQARAQVAITRADQFPSVGVNASHARTRASELGSFPLLPTIDATTRGAAAVVEIDFWGRTGAPARRRARHCSPSGRGACGRASL